MLARISHMKDLTTLRRQQLLPADGLVLKGLGERVVPGEILARSYVSSRNLSLDLSQALGASPARAERFIECQVNDRVEKGAILARRRGLASRLLRAPADGRVSAISHGVIVLQLAEGRLELVARTPGEIIDVEPERGVTIECVAAWLQAVWGNGRIGAGVLQLAGGPDGFFTPAEVELRQRGTILVAGRCNRHQSLELASQAAVRGLILGSLATRLIPMAKKMTYPVVLTDGFGESPMNQFAFDILQRHAGQEAAINAQPADIFTGEYPEVIIPQKVPGTPPLPPSLPNFRVGQNVRIVGASQRGAVGEITALTGPSTLFPNGLRVAGAEVALPGGDRLLFPLANLEVLG
jgi:hypothetical protein